MVPLPIKLFVFEENLCRKKASGLSQVPSSQFRLPSES